MEHIKLVLFCISVLCRTCTSIQEEFVHCMSNHSSTGYIKAFNSLHTPNSSSYSHLLDLAEQNPRWLSSAKSRPLFIITPYTEPEIRAAIICAKKHDLQVRIKSGGHDYEGLSYLCQNLYIIIDLINLRSISIDIDGETAWVQTGATVGELYYSISKSSPIHGFPAGICPSVGLGGHFSGGGFGTLLRKYGLAADNIVDAYLVDANGKILDREAMGEDLFWAIRGGGGASFGVIVAWKIKLVRVPPIVTVFTIKKKLDHEGVKILQRWEHVGNKLMEDLFIRVIIQTADGEDKQKTVEASFVSLYLGPTNELVGLVEQSFPELGLQGEDCREMSWIESVLYFTNYDTGLPLEVLMDRTTQSKGYFKAKSDFVEEPIPGSAWEEIRGILLEDYLGMMIIEPFGGRMDEIAGTELPFPHRKGNLYNIQYFVRWLVDSKAESDKHLNWISKLYKYMTPYVSSSPRAAYINYRDLDIGVNKDGNSSYSQAMVWGKSYFKGNFERLARVKARVDPENIFRDEQSIPLLHQQNYLQQCSTEETAAADKLWLGVEDISKETSRCLQK